MNMRTALFERSVFPFPGLNRRQKTLMMITLGLVTVCGFLAAGVLLDDQRISTHFDQRNLGPSVAHWFGTDWLGRDMLTRTIKGLCLSLGIGLIASVASVIVAMVLGMAAATLGRTVDAIVSFLVDLFLGVPHLVALILIAFVMGGGAKGVIVGVACTHWPSLTRLIRAEVLQLRSADFIKVSRHMGRSRLYVAFHHAMPHLVPQFLVGILLLFPHAILHEASITFLGFGLSPHQPAIGVILSESMKYMATGMWWLAFFPGLSLLAVVRAVDVLGEHLKQLIDPHTAHL